MIHQQLDKAQDAFGDELVWLQRQQACAGEKEHNTQDDSLEKLVLLFPDVPTHHIRLSNKRNSSEGSTDSDFILAHWELENQDADDDEIDDYDHEFQNDSSIDSGPMFFQDGLPISTGTKTKFLYDKNEEFVGTIVQKNSAASAIHEKMIADEIKESINSRPVANVVVQQHSYDKPHQAEITDDKEAWDKEVWDKDRSQDYKYNKVWVETTNGREERTPGYVTNISAAIDALSMNNHIRFRDE
jgi:hypothetical protein